MMISIAWISSSTLLLLSLVLDVSNASSASASASASPWLRSTIKPTATTTGSFFSKRRRPINTRSSSSSVHHILRGGGSADTTRPAITTSTRPATATTTSTPSIHAEYIHQTTGGGIIPKISVTANADNTNTTKTTTTETPTSPSIIDKSTKKILKQQTKVIKKKDKEIKKLHKQIAKKLKNRNATNKRRKFMHFAWGILFASLNHFLPRSTFLPIMSSLTAITLFMELMRYREGFQWINTSMHYLFGKSLRKSEMDGKFTGSLYYFAGVTATSYLYPQSCATLGIIQLAIADPTASYFGRATRHVYWSRINKGFAGGLGRNKGILGFLGGGLACVPINYRILSLACKTVVRSSSRIGSAGAGASTVLAISNPTILIASLVLGLAGAFADLIVPTPALTLPKTICGKTVPPFHLDDNFIVPVLSGYACTQIFKYVLGVPSMIVPLSKYLIV